VLHDACVILGITDSTSTHNTHPVCVFLFRHGAIIMHSGVVIHDKARPMTSRWWQIMVLSFLYCVNCTELVSWFSGKSLKLLTADVRFYG